MCLWNMQNVFQVEIRGMQIAMTNISNLHTYPVCSVNMFPAVILVTDGHLVQLSSDVVGGT